MEPKSKTAHKNKRLTSSLQIRYNISTVSMRYYAEST